MSSTSLRARHRVMGIVAVSLFAALFTRLWYLQVLTTEEYDLAARANRDTRVVAIEAPRGTIYDRNGNPLVRNRRAIQVMVDYQEFTALDAPTQSSLLRRLASDLAADKFRRDSGDLPANDPGALPDEGVPEGTTPTTAPGTTVPPAPSAGVAVGARNPDGQGAAEDVADPAITEESLRERIDDRRFDPLAPIPVATDVSEELEVYLRENAESFPTVIVERVTVREYVYGALLAHVLGYVGAIDDKEIAKLQNEAKPYEKDDEVGKTGVEAGLEDQLRGTPGRVEYEVDARNRVVGRPLSRVEPVAGNDVYLTIDINLQYQVEKGLAAEILRRQGMETTGCQATPTCNPVAGSAVAVDPRDGQVLAMASYPTYDPRIFTGGISEADYDAIASEARVEEHHNPLTNRAISGQYAAGSTFKLFSAYAGLATGMITPEYTYNDTGTYRFCDGGEGCTKRNAGGQGTGPVNLSRALTKSSDTYFYKFANEAWQQRGRIGEEGLQEQMRLWGLGTETGIELPNESPGRIPDPEWLREASYAINDDPQVAADAARWTGGTSANMIIGQGDVLTTPLQLANGYAAFGNGGTVWLPQVVYRVTRANSSTAVEAFTAEELSRVPLQPAWREAMLQGFEGVTKPGGTAAKPFAGLDQSAYGVAGKTGTAQSQGRNDSSLFVAFAPSRAPTIAMSAIIEFGGFGADAAGPVVRRVLDPIAAAGGDLTALNAAGSPFRAPVGGYFDVFAALAETQLEVSENPN